MALNMDDKLKNEKRKNDSRPWWVWGMMGLAALGVVIVIGQMLDILPSRQDALATATSKRSTQTSLDALRSTATPLPTATPRFTLPDDFTLPENRIQPTSDFSNVIPTVAYKLISPRQVYPNPMPLAP